jgi:hypothetical protein
MTLSEGMGWGGICGSVGQEQKKKKKVKEKPPI